MNAKNASVPMQSAFASVIGEERAPVAPLH
jgi:hypothetical protein